MEVLSVSNLDLTKSFDRLDDPTQDLVKSDLMSKSDSGRMLMLHHVESFVAAEDRISIRIKRKLQNLSKMSNISLSSGSSGYGSYGSNSSSINDGGSIFSIESQSNGWHRDKNGNIGIELKTMKIIKSSPELIKKPKPMPRRCLAKRSKTVNGQLKMVSQSDSFVFKHQLTNDDSDQPEPDILATAQPQPDFGWRLSLVTMTKHQMPLRRHLSEVNLLSADDHKNIPTEGLVCCGLEKSNSLDFVDYVNYIKHHKTSFGTKIGDSVTDSNNNMNEAIIRLLFTIKEYRNEDEHQRREDIVNQIGAIELRLFRMINALDIVKLVMRHPLQEDNSLKPLFEFNEIVSRFVASQILSVKDNDNRRAQQILAFLVLAIRLFRGKDDWTSAKAIVNGLQSVKVVQLNREWRLIKANRLEVFSDYLKMSSVLRKSESSILIRQRSTAKENPQQTIPISNLVINLTMMANARWDRLENPAKWLCPPGIITWLTKEMKEDLRTATAELKSQNKKGQYKLVSVDELPGNWNRSLKHLPSQYKLTIIQFLFDYIQDQYRFK